MKKGLPVIVALFVGWVAGAGSWSLIAKDQAPADGQELEEGAPSAVLNPSVDAVGGERWAFLPPPVEMGSPADVSARAALPLAVHDVPADMSVFLMEAGQAVEEAPDDGVVQDTGEFIDADDPQATIAYLNARSDGDTVQDTGEFIDVDNPRVYAGSDSPPRDTGEFIDIDDPQAYAAYWDSEGDGVVHDTGEFIVVDTWLVP